MAELLSDELWGVIEPHLPKRKRRARWRGGRPPIPDRQALTGILFVLRHGLPWGALPKELAPGEIERSKKVYKRLMMCESLFGDADWWMERLAEKGM